MITKTLSSPPAHPAPPWSSRKVFTLALGCLGVLSEGLRLVDHRGGGLVKHLQDGGLAEETVDPIHEVLGHTSPGGEEGVSRGSPGGGGERRGCGGETRG